MNTDKTAAKPPPQKKVSVLAIMRSVLAASFGVQTNSNRQRDFEHGKFHHFVIGGLVFVTVFVLFLVALVKLVLHFAGV